MKKYTIIFIAVALAVVFVGTAMANEWNLYGSARVATFYTSDKLEDRQALDPANRSSIKNTEWNLQTNSRIGANVKGDVIDAQFEFGVTSDPLGGGNVSSRRIYGIWKFADGWGLKVGKDYSPITFFLSGQAFGGDAGLLRVGNAYGLRVGQLELRGKLGPGNFKFAAIQNPAGSVSVIDDNPNDGVVVTGSGSESYIPKLEASYQMMFGDLGSAHAMAGFATQKFYFSETFAGEPIPNQFSKTTNSWMVGLGGDLNFGPMFVKPQASYYQNGGSVGWLGGAIENAAGLGVDAGFLSSGPVLLGNKIIDANALMAMLALGFSPTEQLTLEAGGGYLYSRGKDNSPIKDNTYYELYLQAVYTMAPGVFLVPEVGFRDYGSLEFEDGLTPDADLGNLWYVGAKWQINF